MRILVPGVTKEKCLKNIEAKKAGGWELVSAPRFDDSWIGGRWVAIMRMDDDPEKKDKYHNKFNTFMGHY